MELVFFIMVIMVIMGILFVFYGAAIHPRPRVSKKRASKKRNSYSIEDYD